MDLKARLSRLEDLVMITRTRIEAGVSLLPSDEHDCLPPDGLSPEALETWIEVDGMDASIPPCIG
jgi:hypothetical protein